MATKCEPWWHAYPPLNSITEVIVSKATESFVWIDGRRHSRATEYHYYEPTLEQAKARLVLHHELLVGKAASMLAVRERDLARAKEPRVTFLADEQKATA